MKKLIYSVAGCFAVVLCVNLAMPYSLQPGNARWPNNAKVTMAMNLNFPTASNFNNSALVRSVLQHTMLDTWNPALQSAGISVRYVDGGTTNVKDIGCDQNNVITFTDTASPLSGGTLALAIFYPGPDVGIGYTCGGVTPVTTVPNQILDVDITFNSNLAFSPHGLYTNGTSTSLANDIEATLLHEMGHALGMHHSGIISAVMVPRNQQVYTSRTLSTDDIAGISAVYGVNVPGGSISGRITDTNGAAVFGAHVVLTDATTGLTTVSGLSDKDGNYSIVGFPPGTYKIIVEPLDGPETLGTSDFPTTYVGGNNSFATTFVASPVTVVKGTTLTGQNVTVGAAKTGSISSISVALSTAGGGASALSGALISAPRGQTVTICGNGTTLSGTLTTSAPAAKVVPSAPTLSVLCSGTSIARDFAIAADTPVGFYDVYVGNAAQIGALYITTNPKVGAGGVVEGASFGQTAGSAQLAQGSIISLFGSDLATGLFPDLYFPVPVQLGGAMVRIGDRLAPLYFVSPGQINAMIPYEVSGTVPVSVITGNNSIFSYGNISVVPSAPRIFVISGTQGAVQNGSAADKSAIVDATHQASVGDILVVYAEGLGQTANPASISGIAGGGQITGGLTVNIGGQNATRIDYKGVSPGFVGLYQINVQIPAGVSPGTAVPLFITDAAGNKSNTVTIGVK